jgi:hypothetical protein
MLTLGCHVESVAYTAQQKDPNAIRTTTMRLIRKVIHFTCLRANHNRIREYWYARVRLHISCAASPTRPIKPLKINLFPTTTNGGIRKLIFISNFCSSVMIEMNAFGLVLDFTFHLLLVSRWEGEPCNLQKSNLFSTTIKRDIRKLISFIHSALRS